MASFILSLAKLGPAAWMALLGFWIQSEWEPLHIIAIIVVEFAF